MHRRFRPVFRCAKSVGTLRAKGRVADERKGVSDFESVRPRPPPRPRRLSFLKDFETMLKKNQVTDSLCCGAGAFRAIFLFALLAFCSSAFAGEKLVTITNKKSNGITTF